jgi:hypothetical protein
VHVTNVHEQVLEKDAIHHLIRVLWMRPDQHDGIFRAVRDGLEGVRNPWLDFVALIVSRPDAPGHGPSFYSRDFTLKNFKGL